MPRLVHELGRNRFALAQIDGADDALLTNLHDECSVGERHWGLVAARAPSTDAGRIAASRVGEMVAVHVIPRPHPGVDEVLPLGRGPKAAKK